MSMQRITADTGGTKQPRGLGPARYTSRIHLRQLHYFVAAAEYGSFRKAAEALDLNVSSVSRRIRDLEDELGASLFQRHPGGLRLTEPGAVFLERVRDGLRHIDKGVSHVAAAGRVGRGSLRVGIFSSLASGFLFDLMADFSRRHPSVALTLIDGNPSEHVAAVRNLERDLAFITGTGPWEGCKTETLWVEHVFVVLPNRHPLARRNKLAWTDLRTERFIVSEAAPGPEIHDYLVAHLSGLGASVDIQSHRTGRDNILALVAVDHGLTLTSESTIGAQFPGIAYRPLADEILPFSMVWSARNDNPAARRLMSMARAMRRTGV